MTEDPKRPSKQHHLGRVFNEVPELYDRVRPGYPDELFTDLVAITGMDERSSVLEVGCGTGQATRSLAALGCSVTAVEPGTDMAALARRRIVSFPNVKVETSTFEEWDDLGRRFDVLVAASSWHWVDPSIGWQRAHGVLSPGGWMALLGHVVVRRPGEPEVYAETADLHERFCPRNPSWGHPPLEEDVRTTDEGWGLVDDTEGCGQGSLLTIDHLTYLSVRGTTFDSFQYAHSGKGLLHLSSTAAPFVLGLPAGDSQTGATAMRRHHVKGDQHDGVLVDGTGVGEVVEVLAPWANCRRFSRSIGRRRRPVEQLHGWPGCRRHCPRNSHELPWTVRRRHGQGGRWEVEGALGEVSRVGAGVWVSAMPTTSPMAMAVTIVMSFCRSWKPSMT
ncbi:class I SAM-dependent methyltransferase [Streptomyces sp. NPDC014889]|uniref:class I SAM-dependent methyltransferase n=1 Tax=Streptomyces sp. NPDC014889 TaxID=3364928 RepID=UPI003703461D